VSRLGVTRKSAPDATESDDSSKTIRIVYPKASDCTPRATGRTDLHRDTQSHSVYTSASFIPTSLHPDRYSGPTASRSSLDITTLPIPYDSHDSYSTRNLSVQHLPASSSVQHLPDDLSVHELPGGSSLSVQHLPPGLSVQHLPALPPSPNLGLGGGYMPSTNTSVIDFHLTPTQSPAHLCLLNDQHSRIFPVTPLNSRRYDRKLIVPDKTIPFPIPPLTVSLDPTEPPEGWTPCLHPEGARYFHHEKKRIFTDANLFDPVLLGFIEDNAHKIQDFLRVQGILLEPGVDLVLDEYVYTDDSRGCQYYFVNHDGRAVFWVDKAESDMFSITEELNGIQSPSHLRHELEAQYWYHCEMFPRMLEVTHEIVDELRDVILHALGDSITSATSTVSWKVEDLERMLRITDGFAKNVGRKFSGSSCLLGRLMHHFVRDRVYNFHGEPGARLNVDQSVYDTIRKRTLLITLLTPLLFYAPDFHLVGLQTMHTDGLIRHRGWSDFIKRLNGEWQEFTLYATVVLNANVAFLAIQSVDGGGRSVVDRSPSQVASYLSILTSIGSIIIGLLLLKQNRDQDRETAPDAATLAVLYSLPYAMLIWSMVSFLAAFSFMCFDDSSIITRLLVGIVWAAVAALILWCIVAAWENGQSREWGWLRHFTCTASAGDTADDDDDVSEKAKSETRSSKPPKRKWTWPIITIRKASWDSERTVAE
ncbi:hypothetical protein C8J57DRAFT_1273838, partial [Mycena rebaudengoi]